MAKISHGRSVCGGVGWLLYPVIHPTLDTAGVLSGRSSKRKTSWLETWGGFIVVSGFLSAEQKCQEMPELPLFMLTQDKNKKTCWRIIRVK